MKRAIALLMSLAMLLALLAGCGGRNQADAGTANQGSRANADSNTSGDVGTTRSGNQAVVDDNKVYIGYVTHLTGSRSALGNYGKTTMDAWVDYTDKNGGILGKEVEVVWFDCVDDIQTAINAYELACEDERLSTALFPPTLRTASLFWIWPTRIRCPPSWVVPGMRSMWGMSMSG